MKSIFGRRNGLHLEAENPWQGPDQDGVETMG